MNSTEKVVGFISNHLVDTKIYLNEDMKKHTTFKTGGTADLMIEAQSITQLQILMKYILREKIPYVILGHGSNVLIGDQGIREVVIKIEDNLKRITVEGEKIDAEAGALLADASKYAQKHGLSGVEFASGIPGTVGGAVVMNAGAYGGEIKDVLEEVQVITADGELLVRKSDELEFGYRTSSIQRNGDIVIKAKLSLKKGDQKAIKNYMDELTRKREQSQPLEYPSAGSVFKRPEGYYTGKLIQDAGLQGYQIGGAQVSTKHAGFIVNANNATTRDILNLINHIQNEVKRLYNVELKTEVKVLGEL
ncbi:MAG: UDP-N-acetylmuramate dehydrogenase [Dehalobacterium sp.]